MIFVDDKDLFSGNTFYTKEWSNINCPLHYHNTFEVVFVLSGTFIVEKDYKTYTLSKNDAIIIMPFEFHKFITKSSSNILVLEISTSVISNFNQIFSCKTFENPQFRFCDDYFNDIYSRIKQCNGNLIELSYVFFSVTTIALHNNRLIASNEPDDLFKKALLYINEHFDEDISLKDVASHLNLSYVYLSRMFIQKSKVRFNDFLNNLRIKKALSLLVDTSIPISEIGLLCGWGSIRNFNRVFSKTMECTPKEFRQKNLT